jgi:predicted kinase
MTVPWPGILVLHGSGTGLVAQRLAARLTRAAVVRTDLFDRAVRGTAGRPDPALRQRIALSVVQGYAATGHPVILHGSSSRQEHEDLVGAIADAGLSPVQLVEVSEGEDYGEIARRLIDND